MAPIIAQTSSITAQNSYLFICWQNFYRTSITQQVEQAVNNGRLSNRKESAEQVFISSLIFRQIFRFLSKCLV